MRPMASAPSINARCEIDLSPGTRILPASGARGREEVSGACERDEGWSVMADAVSGNAGSGTVAATPPPAHILVPAGAVFRVFVSLLLTG